MDVLVESRRGRARHRTHWLLLASVMVSMSALPSACGRSAAPAPTLLVFAAASLTAPFEVLAREFERANPPLRVQLQCAGTPQLVLQVREGAAVDVFAAADRPNMQKVVDLGRATAAPRTFAKNRLAIVVARDNPRRVAALADLTRGDLTVALCGPQVPAGRYARQALAKAKLTVHSVSDETNVKALTSKIRLGEVDAGIAYVTDARDAGLTAIAIPEQFAVDIEYPLAVLDCGHQRAAAEQFAAFVTGAAGQQILRDHGFVIP